MGYDAHALVEGRALVICGLTVPYDRGLQGYSDGDVATHAIIDALLGAAALGDIGTHFSTDDPRYKDASSLLLLVDVVRMLHNDGWHAVNLDATIVADQPRIAPYVLEMRMNVASILQVEVGAVSIKATTTDGLGFTGQGRGMAAHAVATIEAFS